MRPWHVIALSTLLATCASCTALGLTNAPRRPARAQHTADVEVLTACLTATPEKGGSGVVISKDRILTAAHVVQCPMGLDPTVVVDPGDGVMHKAHVEVIMPGEDIARLIVDDDFSQWNSPIEFGPMPEIGEHVCWAATLPRSTYRCGTVEGQTDSHQVLIDGFVEHGNSGSGLYDSAGRLVGLMTGTLDCQTGVYCKGWAAGLEGRSWLLP